MPNVLHSPARHLAPGRARDPAVTGVFPEQTGMAILVTGGAGYIGSHTCVELLRSGEDVVVLDNLSNARPEVPKRIEGIAAKSLTTIVGDVRDPALVRQVFAEHPIEAVIHFAGLKAVAESAEKPLLYYQNNVQGTLNLIDAMCSARVRTLVFSSSATVYGNPQRLPLTEDHPLHPANPYGHTKLMIEQILRDQARSDPGWRIALLRYFNPVGAHESGLIGEDPVGTPNNLMPYVARVAVGIYPMLNIFGGDYATPDGTGVRDYVHVVDLAAGHLAALASLRTQEGLFAVNLGTGNGHSVLELVAAFESVSGKSIPARIVDRRLADVASCYADVSLAARLLGWKATRDLRQMCADAWRWQQAHPAG
jgi:UDP-glucose 4-epimerase